MTFVSTKYKAIILRRKGFSYNEIVKNIKVSKSTLNRWIKKEISRDDEQIITKITIKRGKEKVAQLNKQRSLRIKENEIKAQLEYANQINKITKKELFYLGIGLYMAEGAKTGRWKSIFYNSDPLLNRIMMRFYREICHANEKRIHIQLLLHNNISEEKAKKYWSKELSLSLKHFNRASFVLSKASRGKRPKLSLPYGTVQIAVGDKNIVNKIKGWTLGLGKFF